MKLPSRKRNGEVKTVTKPVEETLFKVTNIIKSHEDANKGSPNNFLLSKVDRGELLYRNIFIVRCKFEGSDEKE